MTYEQKKQFIVNFFYYGIILTLGFLAFKFGWKYLTPFVIAFVVAFFLKPLVNKINVYLRVKRSVAAILCVLGFYAVAVGILFFVAVQLVIFGRNLFWALPDFYNSEIAPLVEVLLNRIETVIINIDPTVKQVVEDYSVTVLGKIGDAISAVSMSALSHISSAAARVPSLFIQILITVIASVFISVDYYEITSFIANQLNTRQIAILYEAEIYAKTAIIKYIKSYSLIMLITFAEVGVGLWIMRIRWPFFIGRLIAVFDILPMVGTGGIIIPWGIIAIVMGNIPLGMGMFILYIFVTVVRNTIEPKIIGQQVGLHPVATLIAMFLGTKLLGIVGLFGFPIALVIIKQLNESGKIKLFK